MLDSKFQRVQQCILHNFKLFEGGKYVAALRKNYKDQSEYPVGKHTYKPYLIEERTYYKDLSVLLTISRRQYLVATHKYSEDYYSCMMKANTYGILV